MPDGHSAGTQTDLDVLNISPVTSIDSSGRIELTGAVPFTVCGMYVQVIDLVSCTMSNLETVP